MDMQLVNKGLDFTRKRKKWVMLFAALGVTSYGVYKVYNLPSIAKKRKKLIKLLSTLVSIAEMVSDSALTVGVISNDLKQFLQSESDEVPNSLRQMSKIVKSREFCESAVRVTEALTRGVVKGYQGSKCNDGGYCLNSSSGLFYDRVLDKVFSSSGSGFASVVVGSFARNLVLGFYSNGELSNGGSSDGVVSVLCDERCREIIGDCIQTFVSTAVAVYLDKTMDVNTYDELFAGLTNPRHEKQMREMLVSVCNGSIETLVKTSHQVLSSSESGQKSPDVESSENVSQFVVTRSNSDVVSKTFYSSINDVRNVITVKNNGYGRGPLLGLGEESRKSSEESGKSGWISTISSTLAVPNNRKFVLDVTGRVTFEMVRSFLDFLLEKVSASAKRSARVVNEVIVDQGLQVVRYTSYKAALVAAICILLCLHVLSDTRYLMHA